MVTDRDGRVICFWEITEPEIAAQFADGGDTVFFEARYEGES